MSNHQEVINLAQSLTGNKNLYHLQPYIKITGDSMVGLFLERIVYWSDKSGSDRLRQLEVFYKSAEEWEDEIGFSYAQSRLARDKLERAGFIKTSRHKINPGGPPVIHYCTNMEAIKEAVRQYYGAYAKLDNPEIQESLISEKSTPEIKESAETIEIQESLKSSYNSSNSTNNHKEKEEEIPVFENPQTTDSRWAKIWQLWGDNIHLSESPVVIDEMQQDQYLGCPFEWWQQTITIMARNRVYTWNYARSILDRSIEAKESPDILGPPATKYDKNSARQDNQSPRQPKANKAPLPPTPDADLPAPAPPLPPHVAVWQQVKDVLKSYAILADVEARASPNGTLILVASPSAKEWIEGRLRGKILETAKLFKPEIHKLEVITQ